MCLGPELLTSTLCLSHIGVFLCLCPKGPNLLGFLRAHLQDQLPLLSSTGAGEVVVLLSSFTPRHNVGDEGSVLFSA